MEQAGTSKFFISGGTMPRDSASYIERDSDRILFEALKSGRYCYVLNSRQMGKSSLSVRVMAQLTAGGVHTSLVDLTRIGGRNVTAAQWYAGLCDAVGEDFGLRAEMLDFYRQNALLSPMQRFFSALEEIALAVFPGPISVFVDEIDATKNLAFDADEFFAGIRECFNRRVQNPAFDRLTFCLIGVAVPTDLIRNPSTTPFNIGERILLHDFTLDEMTSFSGALGPNGTSLVERIHYWTGGQPFLSQTLCEAVTLDTTIRTPDDIDRLVRQRMLEPRARLTNINLADVGDRALEAGNTEADPDRFRADLLAAYERAWRGGSIPDDESNRVAVMLKLSGLMRSDGRQLHVRNRIYHHVFDRMWIRENTPERERLRERQAFRRGLFRAASASAAILGVVMALALLAFKSDREAESARIALDYELYVANMNNMRLLEETGDVTRMDAIINLTKDSPYRGFEWSFWQRRIHDSDEEYTLDYTAPGKREEAFISQDGRQLCLHDLLTGTAVIVDRRTKRSVATGKVPKEARLVATSKGFVFVQSDGNAVSVSDLATGKAVTTVAPPTQIYAQPILRGLSDYCMVMLKDPADGNVRSLMLFSLVTGVVKTIIKTSDPISQAALLFNINGTRILYGMAPIEGSRSRALMLLVRDVATKNVIDHFQLPDHASVADYSESGKMVLYRDAEHATLCRDVDLHKTVFERPWDGAELPISAAVSSDDVAMAEYYPDGRATRVKFEGGRPVALGQHIWRLSPADSPKQLLADSTSVRFLSVEGPESSGTVATGVRVARDDQGGIVVFRQHPLGIDHYSSSGWRLLSHVAAPKAIRGNFTYNGRWRLVTSPQKDTALFGDSDGKVPPVRLSPIPVNFSCGADPNSLTIWDPKQHRIAGISASTGKNRWTYAVHGETISGLWVSPDGKSVLALAGDTDMMVLDGGTGALRGTLGGHNVRLSNLSFTADKQGLFTCGADGRVILWDLRTLKRIQEFRGNVAQRMSSADLSPDGSRVATCNLAGSWQLWDAKTGRQLMEIQGSTLPLRSILFTSEGRSILTAGEDNQVRRWDSLNRDPEIRIPVSGDLLKGIAR